MPHEVRIRQNRENLMPMFPIAVAAAAALLCAMILVAPEPSERSRRR
jgi:hypothetical protein